MSEHVTTSRGDTVAYDRRGPDDAPPPAVLFVAGAGPWREIDPGTTAAAEALADCDVVTVVHDRVGRGESRVSGRIDLDRELAAVAALLDVVGPSVLVGHSSGCAIALAAAARGLPVHGLVLWEGPLDPPERHGAVRAWVDAVDARLTAGDLEGAVTEYTRDMPADLIEMMRQFPQYPAMVAGAGAYGADGEALLWASSAPLRDLVGRVDVPVLALVGEQTYEGMVEAAERVAAEVPGASWERLAGAGHSWDPAAMAARVTAVIADVRERMARGTSYRN